MTDIHTDFTANNAAFLKASKEVMAAMDQLRAAEKKTQALTEQTTKSYAEGIKKVNESSRALSQTLVRTGQSLALGFTVPILSIIAVLGQFEQSITRLKVADTFEATAKRFAQDGDKIVETLREASGGTVDDLTLMQSASRALVAGMGGDLQTLGQLMTIARDRANTFGVSTTEAFERIILGISKQEQEILDEIGILVKGQQAFDAYGKSIGKSALELTQAEKVQAFMNAVLKQGTTTLDSTGASLDTSTSAWERNRAALTNNIVAVQRTAVPILASLLSVFNSMPPVFQQGSIALFGFTLLLGPLLSAVGSVGKGFEAGFGLVTKYYKALTASSEITKQAVLVEGQLITIKAAAGAVETTQTAAVARSAVARAAKMAGGIQEKNLLVTLNRVLAVNTGLENVNARAVLREAAARIAAAEASGIQLSQTRALNAAIANQAALGSLGATLSLGSLAAGALAVVSALGVAYVAFKALTKGSDETQESLDRTTERLKAIEDSVNSFSISKEEEITLKVAAVAPDIQEIILSLDQLNTAYGEAQQAAIEFAGASRLPGQNKALFDMIKIGNEASSSIKSLTENLVESGVGSKGLEAVYNQLLTSVTNNSSAIGSYSALIGDNASILASLSMALDEARAKEENLAYAAALLADSNQGLLVSFQQLNDTLQTNFALQNAVASAINTVISAETDEELAQQKIIAEQNIIIANRELELNQFGKQKTAQDEHIDALKAETDAIGKQISAIDIQIKEKELYIKSLVPPQLLREIEVLEDEVKVRSRASFYMGLHISALQREANEVQRAINAIEKQAEAIERANKPLERQINLIDMQSRKLQLLSNPARRRLEDLKKIPGVSQQVINAAQAEVDAFDEQIAEMADSQEAIQLEVDSRQLQADAIRDSTEALNDQLDAINDEIDILSDQQSAYDDVTSAIEDQIDQRHEYIETLVPPELLEEIEKLKELRAELELQKQKLELLIPTRDAVKANTGDIFDPIINSAQATKERAQTLLDKLGEFKNLAAIEIKLKFAQDFQKMLAFLQVIGAADALNAKGISLSSAIGRLTKFAATIGNNWDFILGQLGGSAGGIASIIASLPSAQHGGIYNDSRPTLAMLHGPEAIIPLNSPQSQRMLGSGGGGTTVISFDGAIIMADNPIFLDDLSRKIEQRISRRKR